MSCSRCTELELRIAELECERDYQRVLQVSVLTWLASTLVCSGISGLLLRNLSSGIEDSYTFGNLSRVLLIGAALGISTMPPVTLSAFAILLTGPLYFRVLHYLIGIYVSSLVCIYLSGLDEISDAGKALYLTAYCYCGLLLPLLVLRLLKRQKISISLLPSTPRSQIQILLALTAYIAAMWALGGYVFGGNNGASYEWLNLAVTLYAPGMIDTCVLVAMLFAVLGRHAFRVTRGVAVLFLLSLALVLIAGVSFARIIEIDWIIYILLFVGMWIAGLILSIATTAGCRWIGLRWSTVHSGSIAQRVADATPIQATEPLPNASRSAAVFATEPTGYPQLSRTAVLVDTCLGAT